MEYVLSYEKWKINESHDYHLSLNEEIGISDALHLLGDIAAGIGDVVVPGSGAAIDVVNMLSYFIEAHMSKDENETIKFVLSGLIQAFAIFDPFNMISTLKIGLNKIFTALSSKTRSSIAEAILVTSDIKRAITMIQTKLLGVANKIINALSSSKFGDVVSWLSQKLGVTNVLQWLKNFFSQRVPLYIKKFLTLLSSLNPSRTGATGEEGREFLTKQIGKVVVNSQLSSKFIDSASNLAADWKKQETKK